MVETPKIITLRETVSRKTATLSEVAGPLIEPGGSRLDWCQRSWTGDWSIPAIGSIVRIQQCDSN
jgi:hypothetical protein